MASFYHQALSSNRPANQWMTDDDGIWTLVDHMRVSSQPSLSQTTSRAQALHENSPILGRLFPTLGTRSHPLSGAEVVSIEVEQDLATRQAENMSSSRHSAVPSRSATPIPKMPWECINEILVGIGQAFPPHRSVSPLSRLTTTDEEFQTLFVSMRAREAWRKSPKEHCQLIC